MTQMHSGSKSRETRGRWLFHGVALLAYVLPAVVMQLLSQPLGVAIAFFPSAGIAAGFALVYGRRALPGMLLGAIGFEMYALWGPVEDQAAVWRLVIAISGISLGAMVQAYGLSALWRRGAKGPIELKLLRSQAIARYLLAIPLACLLSSTIGVGRWS
jgi:hypothetical protein